MLCMREGGRPYDRVGEGMMEGENKSVHGGGFGRIRNRYIHRGLGNNDREEDE